MELEYVDAAGKHMTKAKDEEVIALVHQGDRMALDSIIKKYKRFVRLKVRTYYLIGADKEDIIQEGMIGLYKAIRDFDRDKPSSFKAFAEVCVTRQIITAVKTATRQKHLPLNSYMSLDKPMYDEDSERTLLDVITGSGAIDPQELILNREKYTDTELRLSELLSTFEKKVLHLYIDGCTYQEISERLKRHEKSIDNALQRVKRKFDQLLAAEV